MEGTLIKTFLTLVAMVILLWGVLIFVRRYSSARMSGGIGEQFRVVSQLALQPKKGVYLLLVANKILVLGVADSSISTLAEITDPETVKTLSEHQNRLNPFQMPLGINGKIASEVMGNAKNNTESLSFSQFLKSLGKKSG